MSNPLYWTSSSEQLGELGLGCFLLTLERLA